MAGETDLAAILSSLAVRRRPGEFVFVSRSDVDHGLHAVAAAIVREDEGFTYVVRREQLDDESTEPAPPLAWLTIEAHTSLEAVGLTARVAGALAGSGIPCNVIAGSYHDHLLVPVSRADDAERVLAELRRDPG